MIRKIIIGENPLKAMAYYVGQKAGDSVVDSIILDDKYLIKYNKIQYLIYIKHPQDGVMLWKSVMDMPVLIEYDCDFS
jgi:hypothetical protein